MRRIVLAALVIEVFLALFVVYGAIALLLFFDGWTRVAGVALPSKGAP
ncbi:MAG: hypothetical protein ABIT38_14725 [Gemmatimonadaceae bacterium]